MNGQNLLDSTKSYGQILNKITLNDDTTNQFIQLLEFDQDSIVMDAFVEFHANRGGIRSTSSFRSDTLYLQFDSGGSDTMIIDYNKEKKNCCPESKIAGIKYNGENFSGGFYNVSIKYIRK